MPLAGCIESYLGLLAEVRREFQAVDVALVIAYYDDGMDWVELNVCQPGFLFVHHYLMADRLVFVDIEVKNVNLKKSAWKEYFWSHYDTLEL